MRLNRTTTDEEAEVMMSPLIDAVFLLLIFFLVATMFKKEIRDIEITPPQSISDVSLIPEDDTLVLGINPEGEFFWQGQPVTANEMHTRLREETALNPERRIRLDADEHTPFWRVVQVLDALQFRGFQNVGIRTYDERYNRR